MVMQSMNRCMKFGLPLLQERDKRVKLLSRIRSAKVSDTTGDDENY